MPEGHAPFAVFNRSANPLVRLVLSSPLHPLLSGSLALITVTGVKSRRTYTFPVGYKQEGDRVTIGVGWPERKRWWRNLRGGAPVRVRLRGSVLNGHAEARGNERTGVTVVVQLDPPA